MKGILNNTMSQDRKCHWWQSPRLLAWFSCANGVIIGEPKWVSRIGEYKDEKHMVMVLFNKEKDM